jgi:hypothetical protein
VESAQQMERFLPCLFLKDANILRLDAEGIVRTMLSMSEKGHSCTSVSEGEEDGRGTAAFDGGFGGKAHQHNNKDGQEDIDEALTHLATPALVGLNDEKRLHLHEQSGDVFDRMQGFIDEHGGVDDEGVKPFPDKKRDAMFAALLRKVCGSHRARFEAFTVALTKVGNFEKKE